MNFFTSLRNSDKKNNNRQIDNNNYYDKYDKEENDDPHQEQILAQFYLPKPKLELNAGDSRNDWLSVGHTSVQGWRINQEDSHLCDLNFDIVNHVALFGVFDGHNGPEVARYAAKNLPKLLKKNPNYQKKDYDKALEEAFLELDASLLDEEVNQELHKISQEYESTNGRIKRRQHSPLIGMTCGSTAVVALVVKQTGKVHVANIGDSRCVLFIKNKPRPMTVDHKPMDPKEWKRIEKSGSRVINGRINAGLNLSRAFGDFMLKDNLDIGPTEQAVIAQPDLTCSKERIKANDFMLLACDGVWNCMKEKEACQLIKKQLKKDPQQLSKACQEIIQQCVCPIRPIDGQIGGDNITCVIVKFELDLS